MVVGATDATDCSLRLKTKNFGQQKLEKWFHHSIFNVCISVWQSLIHHPFFCFDATICGNPVLQVVVTIGVQSMWLQRELSPLSCW